ncbi:ABC transporter substrate-binding protein [Embleya scabrispora]|uniref:ABC transporter substrate-binding protein n=1 Tax=Embleya scabrispora TaxID=159449 RepID=UPI0003824690|nr:ABC transporter substrate-binding protein [Embleya scabrispora]MYS85112.1 hypothetical protein [Streptomyces sp. SID5474]
MGLATLLALAGCTSGSTPKTDRSSTVVFDMDQGKPDAVTNFSPYGGNQVNGLIQAVYEPLFITDVSTGKLEPWLADDIAPDAANKVWTLKLKNGIKWSDGEPFTADDVVYTVDLIKTGKILSGSLDVKDVTAHAVDPLTVTLEVDKPDPLFALRLFSTALASKTLVVLPKHIWAQQNDVATFTNYDPKKGWPVGTGPYRLASVTPNTFTYTRSDNWWGVAAKFQPLPAPKKLQWTALGTESTRASAMASGALDVGAQFSLGTYQALKANDTKIQTWQTRPPYGQPDVCGYSLDFNTSRSPWNDPKLRWAVNYAIDRQKLIDVAFSGASKPMLTPFPDFPAINQVTAVTGSAEADRTNVGTFDAAKAKSMFEAAGYHRGGSGVFEKDGKKLTLVIKNFDAAPKNAVTAVLVEQLRQIGIDASQDKLTVPNFVADETSGNFQANLFFGSCGSTTHPWESLNAFNVSHLVSKGEKISGFYANPFRWDTDNAKKYSGVVDKLAQVPPNDSTNVQKLVMEALGYWYQDLPMIPLLNNYQINPVSTRNWTDWPTAANPYVWGLYVSSSVQKLLHTIQPAR